MRQGQKMEKTVETMGRVLETIADLWSEGQVPTIRAIQSAAGLSSSSQANRYVRFLEEEGLVKRTPGKAGVWIKGMSVRVPAHPSIDTGNNAL